LMTCFLLWSSSWPILALVILAKLFMTNLEVLVANSWEAPPFYLFLRSLMDVGFLPLFWRIVKPWWETAERHHQLPWILNKEASFFFIPFFFFSLYVF
jgi:hypothetical protein